MLYTLLDLKHYQLSTRDFVGLLEQAILKLLQETYHVAGAHLVDGAPGVYVDGAKICSIGLRVRKSCAYHGISFNVNMDLTPFQYINPCGFKALKMINLADLVAKLEFKAVQQNIIHCVTDALNVEVQKTQQHESHKELYPPTKVGTD